MEYPEGLLFTADFQKKLKAQFYYADEDPVMGQRLFFDNSGGSLHCHGTEDIDRFLAITRTLVSG